ncbi:MAG: zinc ribbon domain-containing protein [Desulfuromonas sp.]|nr:MAG: zinc ribbon domain-containing protein [Desulfuromonas sp.]
MPLFEFHCPACGKDFEKLMKEPQETTPCPACHQLAQRKISIPADTGKSSCTPDSGSGFG